MAIPETLSEVPNLTPYIQYVSGSGQTVFPYPFPITQDSDLVVVINGVTQATDSGYTLSGQGNDTGGNLTFTLGRTVGDIVTLFRDIAIARITQIGQNSGFSSTAFNAEFNNLYLIAQQLEASIAQCLQIPNTNNPSPVTVLTKASYAGLYLSFDANGNPQPAALTPSGSVTSSLINSLINLTIVQTIASLWNPQTATEIANSVTPLNYLYQAGYPPRYAVAGGYGGGTTDDSAAFASAALVSGVHPMIIKKVPGDNKIVTPFALPAGGTMLGFGRPLLFATVNGTQVVSAVGKAGITIDGVLFAGTSSSTLPLNTFGGYANFVTGLVTLVNCTDVRVTNCEASTFYNCFTIQQCTRVFTQFNKATHWVGSGYQWGCNIDTVSVCDTADTSDQAGGVVSYCVQATGNSAGGFPTRNNKWISPTWHNCPSWMALVATITMASRSPTLISAMSARALTWGILTIPTYARTSRWWVVTSSVRLRILGAA